MRRNEKTAKKDMRAHLFVPFLHFDAIKFCIFCDFHYLCKPIIIRVPQKGPKSVCK